MPCQEGRKVYQPKQNTRKDTLLKRQQLVTKNQETSVKTELSPDKLYYKSHLSGLKRFLMDKHLTLSNLSVNAFLSPDKCDSCLGITAALAVHRFWKTKVRNL